MVDISLYDYYAALGRTTELESENAELRQQLEAERDKVLRVVRGDFAQICSYCGWEAPVEGAQWDELQAHIKECPHHPLTAERNARLEAQAALAETIRLANVEMDAHRVEREVLERVQVEHEARVRRLWGMIGAHESAADTAERKLAEVENKRIYEVAAQQELTKFAEQRAERKLAEVEAETIERCANWAKGRKAGRNEASELYREIDKIERGLRELSNRTAGGQEVRLEQSQSAQSEGADSIPVVGKVLPASPAASDYLRGMEWCAEVCDSEQRYFDGAYGENSEGGESARKCADEIRAEIARLSGQKQPNNRADHS